MAYLSDLHTYSKERIEAALRVNNKMFEKEYKKLVEWHDNYEDLIDDQNQLMDELTERTDEGYTENFMNNLPEKKYGKEAHNRKLI